MNKHELITTIKEYAEQKYSHKVLGVFLLGSWAMRLGNKDSDYDMQVWVLPTWDDLVNGKMISKKFKYNNETEGTIKDVRLVPDLFKKQNPSIMVSLNTPYYWLDENWSFLLNDNWRTYDPKRCFVSHVCMAQETVKRYKRDLKNDVAGYSFEKVVSRLWYSYDLCYKLMTEKRFARNEELANTDKYVVVKNGNMTILTSAVECDVEDLVDMFNTKLEAMIVKKPLNGVEVNDGWLKEFMVTFKGVFQNEMVNTTNAK